MAQEAVTRLDDQPDTTTTTADRVTRWRYVSDEQIVYTQIPVSPTYGDVFEWPHPPAEDGRWVKAGRAKVTRLPDNYRDDLAEEAVLVAARAAGARPTADVDADQVDLVDLVTAGGGGSE